jgi:hypothetical protein
VFSNNTSEYGTAGIAYDGISSHGTTAQSYICSTIISYNTANYSVYYDINDVSGGLLVYKGNMTLTNVSIFGNTGNNSGVQFQNSNVTMTGCNVTQNGGYGINCQSTTLNLQGTSIYNNTNNHDFGCTTCQIIGLQTNACLRCAKDVCSECNGTGICSDNFTKFKEEMNCTATYIENLVSTGTTGSTTGATGSNTTESTVTSGTTVSTVIPGTHSSNDIKIVEVVVPIVVVVVVIIGTTFMYPMIKIILKMKQLINM